MRWILGAVTLALGLACAGEGRVVGDQQQAVALREVASGCEWITWSAAAGESVTLFPGSCPYSLAFEPGGARVVMFDGREVSVATEPELQDRRSLPLPAMEAQWMMEVDREGLVHLQGRTEAEHTRKGRDLILTAGEVRRVVRGGVPEALRAELIVHYVTALDTLSWRLVEAEVQQLADMQDFSWLPMPEGEGWPELEPPGTPGEGRSELQGLYPSASPSFLAADMEGWLFGVEADMDGDRVVAPIFGCETPACADRFELQELPEPGWGWQLSGYEDFLLVTGSKETRVYQSLTARPIHVFTGTTARWRLRD